MGVVNRCVLSWFLRAVLLRVVSACILALSSASLYAQSDDQTYPTTIHPTINKGQIGEQLAICSAYASMMENVTIIELKIRDIWRQRHIMLSDELRQHLINHSNQSVLEIDIRYIIDSKATWLSHHIFFPDPEGYGVVNASQQHTVKQYVMSFCPPLYDKIDLQFAEAKGVVEPGSPLTIMTENKWGNGMINTRQDEESDKPDVSEDPNANADADADASANANASADADANADADADVTNQAQAPPTATQSSSPKAMIIQIAAYIKRNHAERGMIHFEDILADITPPVILQIEEPTGDNGEVFYRITTIPMLPDEATLACNNMKKKQIGCIIRLLE